MSLRAISKKNSISESCGRKWKEQWIKLSSAAKRKTRPKSAILRAKSRVTKSMCKMLCSPSRNPVRKHPYETQIAFYDLPVGKRQLQRKMKEYTKGGGRYIIAYVNKVISEKNHAEREKYGSDHV
jgi:transposase